MSNKLKKLGLIIQNNNGLLEITNEGKTQMKLWLTQSISIKEISKSSHILILKFAFMDYLVSQKEKVNFLESFVKLSKSYLKSLEEYHASESILMPLHGRLSFEYGIAEAKSKLSWAKSALKEINKQIYNIKVSHFVRVALVAISLTFLEFFFDFMSGGVSAYSHYLWIVVANLMISWVIGFYVVHSYFHSYILWLATFAIIYIIGNFNILIEVLIFNVTDRSQTIGWLLRGIPFSAIGSFIMIWLFGEWKTEGNSLPEFLSRKIHHWIGRILAGNFLYFFFYIGAGLLLQAFTPRFAEFYEDKIPPFVDIIITNLFFRGFVFVGIAILIDRTLHGSKWTKAILIGLIFSIVGGIAH